MNIKFIQWILCFCFAFSSLFSFAQTLDSNKYINDADIISHIQSSIATNNTVSKLGIFINSENGVVSLVGNTNSNAEASKLIEIAESMKDVKDVDASKLTVNHIPVSSDIATTAKVKGIFIREKLFDNTMTRPLNVQTINGVVTLIGTVESEEQADKAIKLAQLIRGVSQVRSEMIVIQRRENKPI